MVKNRLRSVLGGLSARLKMVPSFLVIGAQKCGTTSLYAALRQHPSCRMPRKKELHFFDTRFHLGMSWYLSYFPFRHGDGAITGEVSPYYLFHPAVPGRVRATLPEAGFIVMLRNPVDRAYSHYSMQRQRGIEDAESFEEAVRREKDRIGGEEEKLLQDSGYRSFPHQKLSYLARGEYLTQIERWLRFFPLDRFHFIRSEDFFADATVELKKACGFLGLEEFRPPDLRPRFTASYPEMDPDLRRRLLDYYAEEIDGLQELLGRDLEWTR
ncbi:sulfotransferase [Candidatus Fermentibacteria bacterium]|nr:sulfotransferase [Candidatus Fermentibacteria bacterium]